ncbi:hypothetical protein ACPA2N_26780, partial [Ectopseudomonas hydrolytica]|uniref:hypothetical protein n=1 Tax=Ectopseudomonas hydrolytica TaxID=2493633 RepID=UPI003C2BD5B8
KNDQFLAVEGRLLIHRGFTGHACRPHEKSGLAFWYFMLVLPPVFCGNLGSSQSDESLSAVDRFC